MLGVREPTLYGSGTLKDLENYIMESSKRFNNVHLEFFQTNHEGTIIDIIQNLVGVANGLIINAGAYTHTSIGILDAIKAVNIPTVEVHLTDVENREVFRHISYISLVAKKIISGKGFDGYVEGLEFLVANFSEQQ
jgi:3-dehydroquinate dehydratase-2